MDEDLEFRDMVLKKLEDNGSLLNIKAKLRALLYDIIENERTCADNSNETDISSSSFEKDTETVEVDTKMLALGLVYDLLETLKLSYTQRVFTAETGYATEKLSRERLLRELGIRPPESASSAEPLLLSVMDRLRAETANNSTANTSDLSSVVREESEAKTDEPCTPP